MKYLKKLKLEFVKGEFKNPIKGQVRDPEQIFGVFKDIKDWTKETVIGVYLNNDLLINSYDILSVGGADFAFLQSYEVFRNAVLTNSRYFVLIHNHTSGRAEPSEEDRQTMQQLKKQAEVMNLSFLDFIIVGDNEYWSMFDNEDGGEYALGAVM